MSRDPNDVMKVYSGPLIDVEMYHQTLKESGIESRVVGTALSSSFGSAIPDSIELWVHREDVDKAVAAIELYEKQKKEHVHEHHRHPTNAPKPMRHPREKNRT